MNAPDIILKMLVSANVIPEKYTGQVILHVGSGSICDIERREKKENIGLIDALKGMNEKILLDKISPLRIMANNSLV
jgi:hypothetical protein